MPNSMFTYLILGAGKQGTAAAYDLARFGQARKILVADLDLQHAQDSATRVNTLIGSESR